MNVDSISLYVFNCLAICFALGSVAKYCDEHVCVCVCVCMSVCPQGYLRNHTRDLYQSICAYCLWPWLGTPPMSLGYVMHFRFCGWHHIVLLQWAV